MTQMLNVAFSPLFTYSILLYNIGWIVQRDLWMRYMLKCIPTFCMFLELYPHRESYIFAFYALGDFFLLSDSKLAFSMGVLSFSMGHLSVLFFSMSSFLSVSFWNSFSDVERVTLVKMLFLFFLWSTLSFSHDKVMLGLYIILLLVYVAECSRIDPLLWMASMVFAFSDLLLGVQMLLGGENIFLEFLSINTYWFAAFLHFYFFALRTLHNF